MDGFISKDQLYWAVLQLRLNIVVVCLVLAYAYVSIEIGVLCLRVFDHKMCCDQKPKVQSEIFSASIIMPCLVVKVME